jgi:hypothetical protein
MYGLQQKKKKKKKEMGCWAVGAGVGIASKNQKVMCTISSGWRQV